MATRVLEPVSQDVFCVHDTCNVYVVRSGDRAVIIDFGRGKVLDCLPELGVEHVDAVLVTHFHRDQVQGLHRAIAAGINVFVPPLERDLIHNAGNLWEKRQLNNDYDLRQDRFSLLYGVPVAGWVREYDWNVFGAFRVLVVPTPGHTVGSESYFVESDGKLIAFVGDLLYAAGKVWSLAATQWSYSGVEGLVATMSSCHEIGRHNTSVLLPSHGAPIRSPAPALALVQRRLQVLVDNWVNHPWSVTDWYREPWQALSPHLLRNRSSVATSYALISDSGNALFIDFGYDICGGMLGQSDRAARRPLLTSLRQLRERFGVEHVETAIPTHYHDDHVAGFNLLHETWGTEIWATSDIADILEHPTHYDLPCLWHDPIPVQRVLEAGTTIAWREYELALYPLPGHTRYACAIAFEVDGRRVLATGDQQNGCWDAEGSRELLNYQYRNGFEIDDYVRSAELYKRLQPELMVSGHWKPKVVTPAYLDMLLERGHELARAHRDLLPLEDADFGAAGFGATIQPYRSELQKGETAELTVRIKNPFHEPSTAVVCLAVPNGWAVEPLNAEVDLAPGSEGEAGFKVITDGKPAHRARVAAELCVGERDFGQQAEALITVK
ncbi:MAG TPA: MBL fold metallo-hydrolase [Acidimicrobiales bacterium]|nr:MBL fold metallo-hydrolase [Acidimicrobiales bacterium]